MSWRNYVTFDTQNFGKNLAQVCLLSMINTHTTEGHGTIHSLAPLERQCIKAHHQVTYTKMVIFRCMLGQNVFTERRRNNNKLPVCFHDCNPLDLDLDRSCDERGLKIMRWRPPFGIQIPSFFFKRKGVTCPYIKRLTNCWHEVKIFFLILPPINSQIVSTHLYLKKLISSENVFVVDNFSPMFCYCSYKLNN